MPNVSKKLKKSADSEKNRPIPSYFSKKSILHFATIHDIRGHNLAKIKRPYPHRTDRLQMHESAIYFALSPWQNDLFSTKETEQNYQ